MKKQHRILKTWSTENSEGRWEFCLQYREWKWLWWSKWFMSARWTTNERSIQDLYLIAVANSGLCVVVAIEPLTN